MRDGGYRRVTVGLPYNRRPMSDHSSQATSRAEARRRARLRAQGRELEEEVIEEEPRARTGTRPAGAGMLERFFPAAPPLPGRRDPLAGYTYSGPFSGIVSGLYLLARSPRWWVIPGAIWAVSEVTARLAVGGVLVATLSSVVAFGALIGAGWFGWQRPWAFGLAAAVLGIGMFAAIVGMAITMAEADVGVRGAALYIGLFTNETFQLFFGAIAGWYGGYLRRRLAASTPPPNRRRSR